MQEWDRGKTYSIIEIVKKYHQETDYIIFIASPFVSLVEQYYHKVSESGIPQESIYRYDWIGNREINTRINISKLQGSYSNCKSTFRKPR